MPTHRGTKGRADKVFAIARAVATSIHPRAVGIQKELGLDDCGMDREVIGRSPVCAIGHPVPETDNTFARDGASS